MNSCLTFFKKELLESHRTKKLYILMAVFLIFGMVSPMTARYMPEILSAALQTAKLLPTAAPKWSDSFSQYYGNLTQIGELSVILLFMGCVSSEKQNNTAALALSKNLSRAGFLLAKYAAGTAVILFSFLPSLLLCSVYTFYLFGYAGRMSELMLSGICYFIFTLLLLSVTVLASTAASSAAGSALISLAGYLLLIFSSYIPHAGKFMPGTLLSSAADIFLYKNITALLLPMATSLLMAALLLFISIQILEHKEI